MRNEELPFGMLSLRSQILHSSFFIKLCLYLRISQKMTNIVLEFYTFLLS